MNQLLEDMKQAMKEKDKLRLSVIRMVKADVDKIRIDQKCDITDAIFFGVLEKQIKMREDSYEQFQKAGREDLAKQTKEELTILKAYLPDPLSLDEVEKILEKAFQELKPEGIRDMGKVMGYMTPLVKGKYDMKQISKMVQERLK